MDKEEAMKILKDFHDKSALFSVRTALETLHPELRESEDEKMMHQLYSWMKEFGGAEEYTEKIYTWLKSLIEKQETSYTKKDVDDAYVEGMAFAKNELEKQGKQEPTDEVGPITQSYIIPNGKFFQWIYDRLVHVHNENPNVDYMLSLKKRIEDMQNPANDDMKEALQTEYEKGRADAIVEIQKSAWSCEDETRLQACLDILQANSLMGTVDTVMTNWLKSLKNRVLPQPKQEWSEEDEKIALSIEQVMNCASLLNIVPEKVDKIRTWLKSLKQRIGG